MIKEDVVKYPVSKRRQSPFLSSCRIIFKYRLWCYLNVMQVLVSWLSRDAFFSVLAPRCASAQFHIYLVVCRAYLSFVISTRLSVYPSWLFLKMLESWHNPFTMETDWLAYFGLAGSRCVSVLFIGPTFFNWQAQVWLSRYLQPWDVGFESRHHVLQKICLIFPIQPQHLLNLCLVMCNA